MDPDVIIKNKIKAYKGNGVKGYYYYIDAKGESRLIPQQDKVSFVLDENKYELISAADAREERARLRKEAASIPKEKISYDDVDVKEVVMKISLKNIKEIASNHDFNLSSRAIEAYRNILSSCEDLDKIIGEYREHYPTMNFIDFDVKSKRFNVCHRNINKSKADIVDEVAEELSSVSIDK